MIWSNDEKEPKNPLAKESIEKLEEHEERLDELESILRALAPGRFPKVSDEDDRVSE